MAKPKLYTKQGTDKAIAKPIEPLATKEELARASAGGKVDLGEYAKRTDLAPLATRADLAGYATKSDVAGVARTSDLTGLATKAELTGLATKADVAGVAHTSDLTGLATKAELTEALKRVGITMCSTEAEAQALPDGTLYFLVSGAAPAPSPTPGPAPAAGPTLVASAAGQVVGQTVTIKVDGKVGDKIVIGLNEKAQGTPANLTVPQGWDQIVAPYWVGTMRAVVITGPWAPTVTLTLSQNAEIGWAAASIRGASTIKAGDVKKRQAPPTETTTCTAPALAGAGVVLGFAFERTSAVESSEQVTVSAGWEKLAFASQEGLNYQTVTLARRTGSQPADLVVTYPNPQGSNGLAVQVIAHA